MNIGLKIVYIYVYSSIYGEKRKNANCYIRSYLYRNFIIKRDYFLEVWLYMKN